MATEEAVSNLGAVASPKPMQEFFPVRQVLGMLQRNERLGEKPPPPLIAPAKPKELQENQDSNTPDTREEIVAESPPSQQDDVSQDPSDPVRGDAAGTLLCFKCGKAFLSATSLRTHLATDYPCNERLSVTLPQGEGKTESKTCFKCGKTFASWQGLRGHLNRIKPCDQEKSAPTTIRRRTAASRTCAKCGKTFSSAQSLRIHMNRVKPCDQDKLSVSTPTTPPATTPPTTPLMMNEEELKKEAERKARARYQARKAYLKKRGRLGELGDPPTLFYISKRNGQGAENETMLKPDLKRSAPEDPSEESDKIAELRMSISAEKSKRDITVATLIAHEWKPRRDEFKGLLERTEVQDSPNEEQSLHAKWSEIAEQVSLKDKAISDFEKQMDSLGEAGDSSRSRYAEMGELSSKMAAEYAAKMSLESERESVYLDLVKSSTRIRALVRNALLR
ncbi:hypothetical protein PF005_g13652 [Phytophthora fragariae]|uniref:C2H2-type domain-containing protein n=2 Tax=Phytophthora TaxID=4783 RepID=A0A6A3K9Y3_9STRA|nr:hypothetical protein PF009_g14970 [Phytophthora fragariae]KAE9039393.1 hypothetical protein PR001_g7520 [Phytophthora rubi]KAE9004196.1 hypothetical protein PF011_g12559 [Phytophthora fragariae]KAE9104654.1 hypothetical protein PF007_g13984 [Phytophthora fragariae]KAE9141675.1 hypothetical protein PF006_g13097 [Phytophthora fragariae]